jgi:mannose-6-phosphate isomerase-like protein (cupin superfamily)
MGSVLEGETNAVQSSGIEERKRIFVHEIAGKYSRLYERIFNQPRVFHSGDVSYEGGPQHWHKSVIDPGKVDLTQMFHCHMDVYVPQSRSQRHAHMNSAVFYILQGKGHDVHDGKIIEWQAGDVVIVEPGCVHQHFNDSKDEFAVVLVIKAKPAFMFSNLIYQKMIIPNAKDPIPGYENIDPTNIDPYQNI